MTLTRQDGRIDDLADRLDVLFEMKLAESFSFFVVWNIPREDILARHCGVPFFLPLCLIPKGSPVIPGL